VGKSSVINTLRKKRVCNVAPIPGETKVWQYITLMKSIYLIDCPGIVPATSNDSPEELLLRGVVRVEKIEHPAQYVDAVLRRVEKKYLLRTYELKDYTDATDFLSQLAKKGGRLLKGGEPDLDSQAKMVITDFLRGKIPWFMPPPKIEGEEGTVAGRDGRLGELGRKRKRDDTEDEGRDGKVNEGDEGEFEGFDDEEREENDEDDAEEESEDGDTGDEAMSDFPSASDDGDGEDISKFDEEDTDEG
jgi:nuclear GTP-binding protein